MANAPVHYRVDFLQEIFLKVTALVFDVLGFILMLTVVGEVGTEALGLAGDIIFFVWFWFLGVNYMGGNARAKMGTLIANSVLESVPFVNGVYPGFSIEAWRLISIMKKEDEEKAKKNAPDPANDNAVIAARQNRAAEIRARQLQQANEEEDLAA